MWTGGRAGAWGSTCRGAFPMGSEWFKVREWVRQPCSGLRVTDPAPAAAPPATPGRPRGRCWEGHRGGGSPCGLGVERDSAWKQGGLPPSALPGAHFPGASSCSTTARVFLLGSGRRSVLRLSDASGTWSLGVRGRGTAGPLRPMSPLAQGSGGARVVSLGCCSLGQPLLCTHRSPLAETRSPHANGRAGMLLGIIHLHRSFRHSYGVQESERSGDY